MIQVGTVQGAAARKYAEFCYRRPLPPPLPNLRTVDPNRLDPLREYPRDTAFYEPTIKTVDLADYEARVGRMGSDGLASVEVWLRPGQYTLAKERKLVFSMKVANAFIHRHHYIDEALKRAFQ